jgi:hypothetical protein
LGKSSLYLRGREQVFDTYTNSVDHAHSKSDRYTDANSFADPDRNSKTNSESNSYTYSDCYADS